MQNRRYVYDVNYINNKITICPEDPLLTMPITTPSLHHHHNITTPSPHHHHTITTSSRYYHSTLILSLPYNYPQNAQILHQQYTHHHRQRYLSAQHRSVITHRHPPSPAITRYQPLIPAIIRRHPPSPAITPITCHHPPSPAITRHHPPSPAITRHHPLSTANTCYHTPSPVIARCDTSSHDEYLAYPVWYQRYLFSYILCSNQHGY